ncbi:MAG TPA: hypothetical protein VEC11_06145 [Allosphingosinicella sp.]|nr:hypothetical protein [Allosphingosinicella sp.]
MNTARKLNRRSFVTRVAGGMIVAGGAAALIVEPVGAQTYSGVTDCDSGSGHDRPGYGTGQRNQYTDSDTGPTGDPRCRGRGPTRREGTPSGHGRYSGPAPNCSDSDGGPGADPGGRGVRCNGQTPNPRLPPGRTRHCSDSDRGNHADPLQQGVRC